MPAFYRACCSVVPMSAALCVCIQFITANSNKHPICSLPAEDSSINAFGSHALRAARLKMVGSCRDDADKARLAELQAYASKLGLESCVDWFVGLQARCAHMLTE